MEISDYTFNNLGRITQDVTDKTQRNVQNTRYTNLNLTNYFSEGVSGNHVDFVSKQPGLSYNGLMGPGLSGSAVQDENNLFWGTEMERSYEKVQLFTRPFLTVPYLGRGSCDPTVESQLQQGEWVRGKKSVSNVNEKNIDTPEAYPLSSKKHIEELALGGWSRGGIDTRTTGDEYFRKN